MRLSLYSIMIGLAGFGIAAAASANPIRYLTLDQYTCREFLSDSADPNQPEKVMRSVMIIAWSTGFAAAYQADKMEASNKDMYLIGTIAGNACRAHPDKLAMDAIGVEIRGLVAKRRSAAGN